MYHLIFTTLLFFLNDTSTTEISTLSLHDALPIFRLRIGNLFPVHLDAALFDQPACFAPRLLGGERSEEHTSELQSHSDLVCRLLLEKKKKQRPLLAARHETRPNPPRSRTWRRTRR